MATTVFRSSNSRWGTALVVLAFLVLEAAVGGGALVSLVKQAVAAQSHAAAVIGN